MARLTRALSADGSVMAMAIDSTDIAARIEQIHETSAVVTAATGRLATCLLYTSFSADVYLCSSNAVTENGELYNVDGNSNRTAAILYGPKSVIMVVGINKIVRNLDEAVQRVKNVSAPANALRLSCGTFCSEKGYCVSLEGKKGGIELCSGCQTDARICCNYVVSARQRQRNRIKVLLVGQDLGY